MRWLTRILLRDRDVDPQPEPPPARGAVSGAPRHPLNTVWPQGTYSHGGEVFMSDQPNAQDVDFMRPANPPDWE